MRLVSGLLLGALAGVAAGIFAAPDKGYKTRERFAKDSGRTRRKAEKSLYNNIESIVDAIGKNSRKKKKKSIFSF